MPRCSKCKTKKDLSEFYKNRTQSKGYSSRCKECSKADQRNLYKDNPERRKTRAKAWKLRYAEDLKVKRRANRKAIYMSESARKYSTTVEAIKELLEITNCQICDAEIIFGHQKSHYRPNIDHCHKTQKIRGVLCGHCNNLLGRAKDSVSILEQAAEYLRKFNGSS